MSSSELWSFLVVNLVHKPQVFDIDVFLQHVALGPGWCVGRLSEVPGCNLWGLWLGSSRDGRQNCGGAGSTGQDLTELCAWRNDQAPCRTFTLNPGCGSRLQCRGRHNALFCPFPQNRVLAFLCCLPCRVARLWKSFPPVMWAR